MQPTTIRSCPLVSLRSLRATRCFVAAVALGAGMSQPAAATAPARSVPLVRPSERLASRTPVSATAVAERTSPHDAHAPLQLAQAPLQGERAPFDAMASDRGMREALAEIGAVSLGDNPFVGPEYLEAMRGQLAGLPPDAPAQARVEIMVRIAHADLWSGKNAAAIELLGQAIELAKTLPAAEQATLTGRARFWLGVAHLREGEQRNCIHLHSAESCIVPLAGGGIHSDKGPGRAAAEAFREVLASEDPEEWLEIVATWLLNVAYMTFGEYPQGVPPEHLVKLDPEPDFPRFAQVAGELGLDVHNLAGGAMIEDLNGDDLADVLFTNCDLRGDPHLFVNVGGGRFEDRTEKARLAGLPGGLNMQQADYDNDGDVDVLVLRGAWLGGRGRHPNSLLRNEGDGTFVDVTFAAGLGESHYPTQAGAWGDYDLDGDLDLYIGNEMSSMGAGGESYPEQLFRNNGDGTFTDVAKQAKLANVLFAKAAQWGDFDDDGYPDLFVSNLNGPNRLYRNLRDGTFEDVAPALGVTEPMRSFGAFFWDYDNDGALDLLVTSYSVDDPTSLAREDLAAAIGWMLGRPPTRETLRLYRGDGKGGFTDVTQQAGLARTTLPMGLNFGDLDNDGFLDFYLATGYPGLEGIVPNIMYQNVGGVRFRDVTTAGGFGHLQKGHGVAFGDLDDDGDQDVVSELGGFYAVDRFRDAVYRNPGFGRHWVRVKLVGTQSNRAGVGARIRVDVSENGGARSIYRWVGTGATFGCNPLRAEIGLGSAERIERMEIRWPGKRNVQTFEGLAVDRGYRVTEGSDEIAVIGDAR